MEGVTEVRGIIIKVMPVGEYDKRITLLTRERGRVSAFARGARRQGSSLMGVTRVFASGTFRLREGRDSWTLYSCRIDNYFGTLTSDMESTCYGTYFLELADYFAREQMSDPQMIRLLYLALSALERPDIPHLLARRIYELRLLVIGGEYHDEPPAGAGEACRYAWKHVCTAPLERLFSFVLSEAVQEEFSRCVEREVKKYVDRPMHSLEILEAL